MIKFSYKVCCSYWLQLSLKNNIVTYFESLIIGLYVFLCFNTNVKFGLNQMLFAIESINLFFMYTFRLQKLEI